MILQTSGSVLPSATRLSYTLKFNAPDCTCPAPPATPGPDEPEPPSDQPTALSPVADTYIEAGDITPEGFEAAIVKESSVLYGEGAYEGLIMVGAADYLEANSQGEAVILSIAEPPVAEIPGEVSK